MTLAISWGSMMTVVVPCGTTALAYSGMGSIVLSTCTWPSMKPGMAKRPLEVDGLPALVLAQADDGVALDGDVGPVDLLGETLTSETFLRTRSAGICPRAVAIVSLSPMAHLLIWITAGPRSIRQRIGS